MIVFEGLRGQDNYFDQLDHILHQGSEVEVRNSITSEILNAVTVVHAPWDHCILIPSRRWNPWLALSESLWILGGCDEVELISPYNSRIVEFSDDGSTLYGAYGKRLYHQIDTLIRRLQKDPSDRRAVLTIWESRDLAAVTKDPPCNDMVMFKIRQGRLHMTVFNRSNDIHWGLYAVNLPTFGLLQEYVAARLGVTMGDQTHISNSLHVYTDEPAAIEISRRMTEQQFRADAILQYPSHKLAFSPANYIHEKHSLFADECRDALTNGRPTHPFLSFARDYLTMYRERDWRPQDLDASYADWILAGEIFADNSTRFTRRRSI